MDSFSTSHHRQILHKLFALVDPPHSDDYFMTVQVLIERLCSHSLFYLLLKETLKEHETTGPHREYVDDLVSNFTYFVKAFFRICEIGQLSPLPFQFPLSVTLGCASMEDYDSGAWTDERLMQEARELNAALHKTGAANEVDQTVGSELDNLDPKPIVRHGWALTQMRIAEQLPPRVQPFWSSWHGLYREISGLDHLHTFMSARTRVDCRSGVLRLVGYLLNEHGFLGPAEKLAQAYPDIWKYRRDFVTNRDYSSEECAKLLGRLKNHLDILLSTTWSIEANLENYAIKTIAYASERIRYLLGHDCDHVIHERDLQLDLAEYLFDKGIVVMTERVLANDRVDIVALNGLDMEIVEVKLFRNQDDLSRVLDGVKQTADYIKRHQRHEGYFVVFEVSDEYKLSVPREYVTDSMRIRIIVIDLLSTAATSDKRAILGVSLGDLDYWLSGNRPALLWNSLSIAKLLTINGIGVMTALRVLKSVENVTALQHVTKELGESIMIKLGEHIVFPENLCP